MKSSFAYLVYLLPICLVISAYLVINRRRETVHLDIKQQEIEAGLTEPVSLHPFIDPAKCLGCGTCVAACPEQNVLGLINGKAELITPTHCIGHGACRTACPSDAITLVFGTEKRGVDIPVVKDNFETNVPGIFIAGELGGMGLIRNAVTQGSEAIDSIRSYLKKRKSTPNTYDVVIIGAGPAGLAASLSAVEHKLNYLTLEQESLGGTVAHYPRGKIVMTQPVILPIIGKTDFTEITKEKLLSFWQDVIARTGVKVNYQESVEAITRENDTFQIRTKNGKYLAHTVLLAIGRRGTPRKLGVPGEDLSKVLYRMIDPEQYAGKHVVVVGGGDSALEAAATIAEMPGSSVTLSYRSDAFGRAKQKNRDRIRNAEANGSLKVMLQSNVVEIKEREIILEQKGTSTAINNDYVIVCAGGILPSSFLKESGVTVETKFGTA